MGIFTRRARVRTHARQVAITVHDGDLELGACAGLHEPMLFDDVALHLVKVLIRATTETSTTRRQRVDEHGRPRTDALGSVYLVYTLPSGATMHVTSTNMQHHGGSALCRASLRLSANAEETDAVALVDRVADEAMVKLRALNTLASLDGDSH